MRTRLSELTSEELKALVGSAADLDTGEVLEILRSPFCTAEIAESVASVPSWSRAHSVRELLASSRGVSLARAMDLLSTLPWVSLLRVAQEPKAPPVVRRHAEKKLLDRLPKLTLGEKIALARRAHRPVLRTLLAVRDPQVLEALLDNPRLVENDVVLMVNSGVARSAEVYQAIARHHRWGSCREIGRVLASSPDVPLPLALSAAVRLSTEELRRMVRRPDLAEPVRAALWELVARRRRRAAAAGE